MAIKLTSGDLLRQSDVDAIVNTVNCVGVMGKGIALQFKKKWPENFKAYERACKNAEVEIGKMFVFDSGGLVKPNYIINFPTKKHWRGVSKFEYITKGLADLVSVIKEHKIKTIAMPPLGCGNGGLDWDIVKPLIERAFESLPNVEVRLFEPNGSPAPRTLQVATKAPKMTAGRAAILKLLDTYKALNYGLSKIEVQKLAYFLQESGENHLKLQFAKNDYGPYSEPLRHALNAMDGHFIYGLGDGVSDSDIVPDPNALKAADEFIALQESSKLRANVQRVERLIDGFQSPYGMELLATVHWVVKHEAINQQLDEVVSRVHGWNIRKKKLMKPEHIEVALNQLKAENWI